MPAELDGKHLGKPSRPAAPEPGKRIGVAEFKFSGEIKNPQSAENAAGIPKEWIEIGKEMSLGEKGKPDSQMVIILRFSQPRGMQHWGKGNFKPKNMIALNTDPVTGKCTAMGKTQAEIAAKMKIACAWSTMHGRTKFCVCPTD